MKTIMKRRRREGKTDYKARLKMLSGREARIVFRKTNKYIIAQYVKSSSAQDSVVLGLDSRELAKFGWTGKSIKSIPAAYLTGFLLGRRIVDREGNVKAIFDLGLQRHTPRSRAYSFLKGVTDAGVNVSCNKESFPEEARIIGKHLKKGIEFGKIKEKIENE